MQSVPANLQQLCMWADSRSFPALSWPILPECVQTVPSITSRLMRWTPPSGGWQLSFVGVHRSPCPQMAETWPTLAYNTRRGVGKGGEHPLLDDPQQNAEHKPLRVGSICLPWRIHTAAPPSLPLVPMLKWRLLLFDRFSEVDLCWYTHKHTLSGILLSHGKEWNFATCNKMDGLGRYYAKWNKSDCFISLTCVIEKINI